MNELKSFKDLGVSVPESESLEGPKIDINKLFGREIVIHKYLLKPSIIKDHKNPTCLWMQISIEGNKRVVFSGSSYLQKMIKQIPYPEGFPFKTVIVKKDNDSHQFT
jgi:hypothetical protein